MADPHPEQSSGGGEAKGSPPGSAGDEPSRTATPDSALPEEESAADSDRISPSRPAAADLSLRDTGGPVTRPAGGKGSPTLALRLRRAHAALAPWVLAPLLLTVSTGLGYRLLRDWGGMGRDQAHGLMVLHEGEWLRHWLGPSGETLYVLANGLGLLWMLGTGGAMLWQRWRRSGDRARG